MRTGFFKTEDGTEKNKYYSGGRKRAEGGWGKGEIDIALALGRLANVEDVVGDVLVVYGCSLSAFCVILRERVERNERGNKCHGGLRGERSVYCVDYG